MNALAKPIPITSASAFDAWVDRLKVLFERRRDVDWEICDCLHEGKEDGYLTQGGFDFLSEQLGVAPKRLKVAQKTAEIFPPALRCPSLTVEHHSVVASMPAQDALPLLKLAAEKHWQVSDLNEAAIQKKYEARSQYRDEDIHTALKSEMVRAYNRGTEEAQREFVVQLIYSLFDGPTADGIVEKLDDANFDIIDEDEAK